MGRAGAWAQLGCGYGLHWRKEKPKPCVEAGSCLPEAGRAETALPAGVLEGSRGRKRILTHFWLIK